MSEDSVEQKDLTPLAKIVMTKGTYFSIISYLSGIVYFCLLVSDEFSDKTYFSDNALLPGLVNREFTYGSHAENLVKLLETETEKAVGKMPVNFIMDQFTQQGLEVYDHNFTVRYPFGTKPVFEGRNVYAIFRAARAPSTEAIVVSSPFRSKDSSHGTTIPSVALMISLAKYVSNKNYWAKDLIFLVGDHELLGIQAWVNAYHNIPVREDDVINHSFLPAVSGPIQAALNLELHSTKMSRLEVKIEGLNGQLPNLDLFNIVVELATRESVTATFHGKSHPYVSGSAFESWKNSYAPVILAMMISQGSTLPTGAHALFQKMAIQSLTLEGITFKKKDGVSVNLLQVGRTIEGVLRSVNNLLEKFNRSYWFYLLPSTRRYISIGFYMIPFALITIPLLVSALKQYVQLMKRGSDSTEEASLESGLPYVLYSHALGLILVSLPSLISKYGHLLPEQYIRSTHDTLFYSILTFCILATITPISRMRDQQSVNATRVIALLNAALFLSSLSLINISLAIFLSLVMVPVFCLVGPTASTTRLRILKRISKAILLIMIHPLMISLLCLIGLSVYETSKMKCPFGHVLRAIAGLKKQIVYFIEDWFMISNWTFSWVSLFLFPLWFTFWQIV
jgi:glycosylphosphatidylinositol transamidase